MPRMCRYPVSGSVRRPRAGTPVLPRDGAPPPRQSGDGVRKRC